MPKTYLLAACAAASLSCAANAATLISAAVFGSVNPTVWGTANAAGTSAGNYTLFLQNPNLGSFLNPNDEQIGFAAQDGNNYAFLAGDGFPVGGTQNSDPAYRLELTFDNGAVLRGSYLSGSANTFIGGAPVMIGDTTLTLTEFSFTRSLADVVGEYRAIPQSGDGNDYAGNFSFTQSTSVVPEPAQWALMLGGFGLLGLGLRRRRSNAASSVFA